MASPTSTFGRSRTPSGVHRQPPSHTSGLRVHHPANCASGELRFPTSACNRQRVSSDPHRVFSNTHEPLRKLTGLFEVHRTPSGVRRQPHHSNLRDFTRVSSGFVARPAEYARASALHSCVMTATGCLRTPTEPSGSTGSLRDSMPAIQSHRTAATESLQRPFVAGSFIERCTDRTPRWSTLWRPQASASLWETKLTPDSRHR